MNEMNLKNIIEDQIETFLYAGHVAIKLRNEGLKKETKSDCKILVFKAIVARVLSVPRERSTGNRLLTKSPSPFLS